MKATLDIPDDLYRRVKARSAMEGRPLRSVAISLLQQWLDGDNSPPSNGDFTAPGDRSSTRFDGAPWVAVSRRYIHPGMSHDMEKMRDAASAAWAKEATESLKPIGPKA
jgi:hypothetical protein